MQQSLEGEEVCAKEASIGKMHLQAVWSCASIKNKDTRVPNIYTNVRILRRGSLSTSSPTQVCHWQNDWETFICVFLCCVCNVSLYFTAAVTSECFPSHNQSTTSSHHFGGNWRGASHQQQWSSCSSASLGSGWPLALCVCAPFFFFFFYSFHVTEIPLRKTSGFNRRLETTIKKKKIKDQTTQSYSLRVFIEKLSSMTNIWNVTKRVVLFFFVHNVNEW